MTNLIAWLLFGLLAGAVARIFVSGPSALGCLGTSALGIAGSMVGGFLVSILRGSPGADFEPSNFLGSVIGAIIVLVIWRRFNAGQAPPY